MRSLLGVERDLHTFAHNFLVVRSVFARQILHRSDGVMSMSVGHTGYMMGARTPSMAVAFHGWDRRPWCMNMHSDHHASFWMKFCMSDRNVMNLWSFGVAERTDSGTDLLRLNLGFRRSRWTIFILTYRFDLARWSERAVAIFCCWKSCWTSCTATVPATHPLTQRFPTCIEGW